MVEQTKLTGMIMTHNNQDTITGCLESIKSICDEIILIDDYSTDDTVKVAKKVCPKLRLYQRKLNKDFASQRNFALQKPKNEWVLFIDSDEALSKKLKQEILSVLQKPKFDAYLSRRDNQVMDAFFPKDSGRPILLKKHLKFKGHIHENVYGTQLGFLKSPLIHYSWKNCNAWIDDLNKYSYMYAHKWYEEGRVYSKFQVFLIGAVFPFWFFFKLFVLDGRWRGGWVSLLYCMGWSAQWQFTALKYYEMKYLGKKY